MKIFETLASPCSKPSIRSILTGGLSGQWTIPLHSGTETSIHSAFAVRDSLDNARLPPLSEHSVEVEGGANEGQCR